MALNDYHWKVKTAPTVGGNGDLHFDLYVELCTVVTPETWQVLEAGHYTLVMPAADLLAITNGGGTTAQKIAAVKLWITDKVKLRGVSISDQARRALISLLPGGVWPTAGVVQVFVP